MRRFHEPVHFTQHSSEFLPSFLTTCPAPETYRGWHEVTCADDMVLPASLHRSRQSTDAVVAAPGAGVPARRPDADLPAASAAAAAAAPDGRSLRTAIRRDDAQPGRRRHAGAGSRDRRAAAGVAVRVAVRKASLHLS